MYTNVEGVSPMSIPKFTKKLGKCLTSTMKKNGGASKKMTRLHNVFI